MTPRQKKLIDRACYIGTVERIGFYEHPDFGDDVGMLAVFYGRVVQTDWYDLPEPDDIGKPEEFMDIYA